VESERAEASVESEECPRDGGDEPGQATARPKPVRRKGYAE
jgi:hypothetical protein